MRQTISLVFALLLVTMFRAEAQYGPELVHPFGFAMSLPSGWGAAPVDDGQYQLVPPGKTDNEVFLVLAAPISGDIRDATDYRVLRDSEEGLLETYPLMSRVGEPMVVDTVLGRGVTLTYDGKTYLGSRNMQLTQSIVVVDGLAISLMAVGLRREMTARKPDLEAIFASVRMAGSAPAGQGYYGQQDPYGRQYQGNDGYYAQQDPYGGQHQGNDGYYAQQDPYGSQHQGNDGYYAQQDPYTSQPQYGQGQGHGHGSPGFGIGARGAVTPAPSGGQASSLHDGSPAARQWAELLSGRHLVSMSGYTSGGSSGGMSSRTDLKLYANGYFEYHSSSSVSINVEGLSGGSADEQSEEGTWRVLSSGGQVLLELTTQTARFQDALERSGNEIIVGATRMRVANP
jgi:hypothetical protein